MLFSSPNSSSYFVVLVARPIHPTLPTSVKFQKRSHISKTGRGGTARDRFPPEINLFGLPPLLGSPNSKNKRPEAHHEYHSLRVPDSAGTGNPGPND